MEKNQSKAANIGVGSVRRVWFHINALQRLNEMMRSRLAIWAIGLLGVVAEKFKSGALHIGQNLLVALVALYSGLTTRKRREYVISV